MEFETKALNLEAANGFVDYLSFTLAGVLSEHLDLRNGFEDYFGVKADKNMESTCLMFSSYVLDTSRVKLWNRIYGC